MSGGSFDYLYAKDVVQMLDAIPREHLDAMRAELVERGLSDVVAEHDAVVEFLEGLQRQVDNGEKLLGRLSPVWKAVEWHVSRDWGPERVDEAVLAYRGAVPPSPEILSLWVSVDRDEPYEAPLLTLVRPRGHDPTVFPVRDEVMVGVAAPGRDTVLTVDLGRTDRAAVCRQQKPVRASDRGRVFLCVPVPRGEDESSEHPVHCFFVHVGFGVAPGHAKGGG